MEVVSPDGSAKQYRVTPTSPFKKTDSFLKVAGYVPLFKVTPYGELIGLQPANP
jgi:hypothetical protein